MFNVKLLDDDLDQLAQDHNNFLRVYKNTSTMTSREQVTADMLETGDGGLRAFERSPPLPREFSRLPSKKKPGNREEQRAAATGCGCG